MESITWLRPEYQGREDELITLSAAADLAGVSRSAVSNWAKRHDDFPKIALLTGIGKRRNKYIPRDEFLIWASAQLGKKQGGARPGPWRPTTVRRADEVAYHERQITRLTDLARRQAAALRRTRASLRGHRAALERAREGLAAEINAVHDLEHPAIATTEDPS
ncbi:hypothetical protein ACQF36_22360 [Streptomyces sp. Marseille-Q5077]|uniref:hypothetical protein n=1 Tax=Streptomyces sp. Marseille-Q5077 TaxID=3418995 RepID=UPI003D070AE8